VERRSEGKGNSKNKGKRELGKRRENIGKDGKEMKGEGSSQAVLKERRKWELGKEGKRRERKRDIWRSIGREYGDSWRKRGGKKGRKGGKKEGRKGRW